MTAETHDDTVVDRFEAARTDLTPLHALAGLSLGLSIAFALLFLQEPLAHDAMHTFRHAAGITCH